MVERHGRSESLVIESLACQFDVLAYACGKLQPLLKAVPPASQYNCFNFYKDESSWIHCSALSTLAGFVVLCNVTALPCPSALCANIKRTFLNACGLFACSDHCSITTNIQLNSSFKNSNYSTPPIPQSTSLLISEITMANPYEGSKIPHHPLQPH